MSQGDQPSSQLPISAEQARTVLQQGELDQDYGMLRWSSNYAFLVGVTFEGSTLTAVYKPQQGERPLWDFPDGTLCYREYASYLTSEELGWDVVPPTALKQGKRGLGSVQFFVDHDPDIHYFTFDQTVHPQLRRIALFDVLVNNADRKGGHCLLDSNGHIWGIDHGITFHAAYKLRTVIWDFAGQPVPDNLLADVERLYVILEKIDAPYRVALTELLSASEARALQRRIRHILETCAYPLPGAGPNYPWPPV
jgi:hypothetical protein